MAKSNVLKLAFPKQSLPNLSPAKSVKMITNESASQDQPDYILTMTYDHTVQEDKAPLQDMLILATNTKGGHTIFVDASIPMNMDIQDAVNGIFNHSKNQPNEDYSLAYSDARTIFGGNRYQSRIEPILHERALMAAINMSALNIKNNNANAFLEEYKAPVDAFLSHLDRDIIETMQYADMVDIATYNALYEVVYNENEPKNKAALSFIKKYPFFIDKINLYQKPFNCLSNNNLEAYEEDLHTHLTKNAPDTLSNEQKDKKAQEIMTWLEGKTYHDFEDPRNSLGSRVLIETPIACLKKLFLLDQNAWPNNPQEWKFIETLHTDILNSGKDLAMFTDIIHNMFTGIPSDIRAERIALVANLQERGAINRIREITKAGGPSPVQKKTELKLIHKTTAPRPSSFHPTSKKPTNLDL